MELTSKLTKLETYKQYMHAIGEIPSYQLDKAFACGLPAVWLYMKAIGLEEVYFDILSKIKDRNILFKELFYLLILTNGDNKYFPHVPEDFLNIQIPKEILDAQPEMHEPEFEFAFVFDRDQLKRTLEMIAKPHKMIQLGNKQRAIGIMFNDNVYHVYHADNPRALQFNHVDGCVDLIMRVMG